MPGARDPQAERAALPDPLGGPASQAGTTLGTDAASSPLEISEGTRPPLAMDRLDVATPVADLGTEELSPG